MATNEVRVKNEPIYDSQSISQTKEANSSNSLPNRTQSNEAIRIKEEPIDSDIQKFKTRIESISKEVEIKEEEKFSATEEFTNKISIAFLNEETTTSIEVTPKTSNSQTIKTNKLEKSNVSSDDKRRYKCNICNKSFCHPSHLVIHQRFHTGERPYVCDICKRGFSKSSDFERHKRIHTGERPFKCDICEKSFSQSSNLVDHKRIHTGERPYVCDICKRGFTLSSHLIKHKRIHTGERPYVCDICNKCFNRSGVLKIHKRIHTGEKPFKCDICNKCCTTSGNLSSHQRVHNRENSFQI